MRATVRRWASVPRCRRARKCSGVVALDATNARDFGLHVGTLLEFAPGGIDAYIARQRRIHAHVLQAGQRVAAFQRRAQLLDQRGGGSIQIPFFQQHLAIEEPRVLALGDDDSTCGGGSGGITTLAGGDEMDQGLCGLAIAAQTGQCGHRGLCFLRLAE